ncbi:MAG TPA: hypothetical protein VKV19_07570, partial [Ktedonobacteraceae bacterium]|nr:hypothetical protein [Ktedonobacteraceae bacterium]
MSRSCQVAFSRTTLVELQNTLFARELISGRSGMMNKRINLSVRDARDDERAAIRTVTLAAYEEYAAVMP